MGGKAEHSRTVDNYKRYNIYAVRIPEGNEKGNGTEEILKIVRKIFPKLTDTKSQTQEDQRLRNINTK